MGKPPFPGDLNGKLHRLIYKWMIAGGASLDKTQSQSTGFVGKYKFVLSKHKHAAYDSMITKNPPNANPPNASLPEFQRVSF